MTPLRCVTFVPLVTLVTLAGCRREAEPASAPATQHAPAPTNRVDIPASVRQNLGITFAKVQKRAVGRTLRIPGSFEALPTARQEHRAPAPGRVQLLVNPAATVDSGTPLYRLDTPRLRELQERLAEAIAATSLATAGLDAMGPLRQAHEVHEQNLRTAEQMWAARVAKLEELRAAGAGSGANIAEAQAALAAARADISEAHEKHAELDAQEGKLRAEQSAATLRVELTLSSLASLTGVPVGELQGLAGGGAPSWRTLSIVEVRATAPGAVENIAVSNGSWVDATAPVLSVVDPTRVLFRAHAPQADLRRITPGMPAVIVPPIGDPASAAAPLRGTLAIAPVADPQQRSIDLLVTPSSPIPWARAGVSGFLELTPQDEGSNSQLAVPVQAVARDGLTPIIFRRDPKNPDRVMRLEADLGEDDGRFVVVNSGVREGDEVVVDGVYQLMVATSGTAQKGGHFHADGTFHEGED
ncbi:MAG TPA: HlyD family efflux transporter periplasmic adaptor subunit [Phycisphaerales bacterium]|nr:HlyD family efflux transporter periplasmic adaptor subunit [Phycisphaerales bacterium]